MSAPVRRRSRKVMQDKVLVDLYQSRDDGLLGIGGHCLTINSVHLLVVNHAAKERVNIS